MNNWFNSFIFASSFTIVTWSISNQALAVENKPQSSPDVISQLTSVSQLSDVRPTDWAFQALQSLIERYGCIAGYPNRTHRGNQAMTRYEFAASLNTCLQRVQELIATARDNLVTKEDLALLQKLQAEFSTELGTLSRRVDVLESKTAELEVNQFSTNTKLAGEVIFATAGAFGENAADSDDNPNNNPELDENVIFAQRVR
jgi:Carbohydrate-selective porin, OprB family/S-layer homology domain